jgi:hypothetical protein
VRDIHQKCQNVFWGERLAQTAPMWFPDRLLHTTRTTSPNEDDVTITARVVLKLEPSDFPPEKVANGLTYISLSHSWGPAPDPSAPLGGRIGSVLTASTLPIWQKDLPLDDLPLTFQHAVMACTQLGFEYIWIDSLCILQDSREDWEAQSAVMGDVYKFAISKLFKYFMPLFAYIARFNTLSVVIDLSRYSKHSSKLAKRLNSSWLSNADSENLQWLNIAALNTESDYEGFINESRDPRVEFGFRARFADILGRNCEDKNSDGQHCILLNGQATLLFSSSFDAPGRTVRHAPLFQRAWVFQERDLSRRTLAFSKECVYWGCDEYWRSEDSSIALEGSSLRRMLHSVFDSLAISVDAPSSRLKERAWELLNRFDSHWHGCVTSYTLCKLTKRSGQAYCHLFGCTRAC